jgi:hypothetical protein
LGKGSDLDGGGQREGAQKKKLIACKIISDKNSFQII